MGRPPFHRTSNKLEHHFSNIEQTRTCSSIGDWTGTPYFLLWTNENWTLNLIGFSLNIFTKLNFFEHRTCSSIDNRTPTPYIWLWMIEHRTSKIVGPITIKLRKWLQASFFAIALLKLLLIQAVFRWHQGTFSLFWIIQWQRIISKEILMIWITMLKQLILFLKVRFHFKLFWLELTLYILRSKSFSQILLATR